MKEKQNEDFEVKELMGKFTMDTIASCAFGVDAQSFNSAKISPFVQNATSFQKMTGLESLKVALASLPFGGKILTTLKIPFSKVAETDFFYNVVMDSMKLRQENKEKRNDLVDMMIEAFRDLEHKSSNEKLDEVAIVAAAIGFLVAGYDTTGTTLSYACYQLAKSPEIQEKLRKEILQCSKSEQLTYDEIQSMEYLEQVIFETLRFYNLLGALARVSEKDYPVPGTDLVLPAFTGVFINVMAIHFDPEHYANPPVFDPDHFSREAKANRHP